MAKNPSPAFFAIIQNYAACDPYLIKVALSYCQLICEKFGEQAVRSILVENTLGYYIESLASKYSENEELVQMVNAFMDKYLYQDENIGAELAAFDELQ